MKKPFTLEEYLKEPTKKVVTGMGFPARIVCTDMAGELPIVALILIPSDLDEHEETCVLFDEYGRNQLGEPMYDQLFLVTYEPELTEFEQAVRNTMICAIRYDDEKVREEAKYLLDAARKQLYGEMFSSKAEETSLYKAGYEKGKADALEDLPRWKEDKSFDREGVFIGIKKRDFYLCHTGYAVNVEALFSRLPKEKE